MVRVSPRSALGPLVLSLVAGLCSTSYAQSGTATVDPNSPAGTEYQIPVATARDEGRGGKGGTKTGKDSLFGEGIKPKKGASATTRRHGRNTGSAAKTPTARKPGAATSSQAPAPTATPRTHLTAADTDSPSAGGGTLAAIAGGSLVLVLLAAAFGGYLRQRSGPRADTADPR